MSEVHQDMDLGFGPDPVKPEEAPLPVPGNVTLSQEQFQELLTSLGKQRQTEDYAAAITGQPFVQQGLPPVDLSQLPDPRVDYEGFRNGLGQMLTGARAELIEHSRQVAVQVQERTSLVDQAWTLMQERYPDISVHSEIVQMAAQREMDDLRARGIDPIAVLSNNMDGAIEQIANRAGATIGRIRGLQSGDDDGSADRTDVLDGGSPAPRRSGSQRGSVPTSFVDDLKKMQRELGIY